MTTKIELTETVVRRIRESEGPLELIDPDGRPVGTVRRPPIEAEILRAKERASRGGRTITWDELMHRVRDDVES